MAGNKDVNSNLNILGKAIISTLPNSSGSVVTWNSISKELSQRTNSEFISDLALATESWVISQNYLTSASLNNYVTTNTTQTINASKTFIGNTFVQSRFAVKGNDGNDWIVLHGGLRRGVIKDPDGIYQEVRFIGWQSINDYPNLGNFPYFGFNHPSSRIVVRTNLDQYTDKALAVGGPSYIESISTQFHGDSSQWKQAHNWGNHAAAGYLTSASLSGYATQNWVTSQGYITNAALNGYATETWVINNYVPNTYVKTNFASARMAVIPGVGVTNAPVLGSPAISSMFLAGDNGLWGTYFGHHSTTGALWVQAQRNDGPTIAYGIDLNPAGGDVRVNNHSVWHAGNFNPSNYYTKTESLDLFVGLTGVQTIADTKTFTASPIVPNGTLSNHAVNLEQLNTEIGNIQIGGRNVVLNSVVEKSGQYNNYQTIYPNNPELVGKTVAVSFDLETASGNDFQIYSVNGTRLEYYTRFITQTSGKKRYTFIFDLVDNNSINPYVLKVETYSNNNIPYTVSKVKIELGNKATDWTPAPEDQVADWNQTDVTAFNFIKNKPTSLPPTAHAHVIGDVTGLQTALDNKENAFAKNSAFNKNFGTAAGTVAEGNHTHSQYLDQDLEVDVSAESGNLRINPIEIFFDGSGNKEFDGSKNPHRLVYIILGDAADSLDLVNLQPKQRIVIFNMTANTIGIKEDIASSVYSLYSEKKVSVYKIQNSYYSVNSAIFYDETGLTMM